MVVCQAIKLLTERGGEEESNELQLTLKCKRQCKRWLVFHPPHDYLYTEFDGSMKFAFLSPISMQHLRWMAMVEKWHHMARKRRIERKCTNCIYYKQKNVCQTFCSSAAQWQRIIFNCLCGFSLAWTDFGMTVSMHVINAYDIDIHWVQSSSDNEIERKNNDLATWHFALFWNVNTVHTLMALLKCWQTTANISIVSDYAYAFKSGSYVLCVCVCVSLRCVRWYQKPLTKSVCMIKISWRYIEPLLVYKTNKSQTGKAYDHFIRANDLSFLSFYFDWDAFSQRRVNCIMVIYS